MPPGAKTGGAFIHDPKVSKNKLQLNISFVPLLNSRNLIIWTILETCNSFKNQGVQIIKFMFVNNFNSCSTPHKLGGHEKNCIIIQKAGK